MLSTGVICVFQVRLFGQNSRYLVSIHIRKAPSRCVWVESQSKKPRRFRDGGNRVMCGKNWAITLVRCGRVLGCASSCISCPYLSYANTDHVRNHSGKAVCGGLGLKLFGNSNSYYIYPPLDRPYHHLPNFTTNLHQPFLHEGRVTSR